MTNPFVWNRALASKQGIMGRQELARQVAAKLDSGEHLRIIGPRGTGKTTFAYQVAREVEGCNLVYLNFDQAFSRQALAEEILSAIDDVKSRSLRSHIVKRLSAHELNLAPKIGTKGVDASIGEWKRSRQGIDYAASGLVIEVVFAAIASSGKRCLVVLDEFQALVGWPESERLAMLGLIRRKLMRAGTSDKVSLLFTGSMQSGLRELLEREGTPIVNRTSALELPALDALEVGRELSRLAKASGKPLDDDAAHEIMRVSQLHPMSLQRLAAQAWNEADRRIDLPCVQAAFARIMDEREGTFRAQDQTLARTADQLRRVLYLVADAGGVDLVTDAHAQAYGVTSGKSGIRRSLEKLERQAYVEQLSPGGKNRKGQVWRITDPFLGQWLAANSPLRPR
jgi:hypothetical protein